MTTDQLLRELWAADPGDPLPEYDDQRLLAEIDAKAGKPIRLPARPQTGTTWRLPARRQLTSAAAAFVVVLGTVALALLLAPGGDDGPAAEPDPVLSTTTLTAPDAAFSPVPGSEDPAPPDAPPQPGGEGAVLRSAVTGGTPLPDVANAVPGDDGAGPLPLGTITELPGEDYLDFLFEFCTPDCFRDAHFMNPDDPNLGSGPWTVGRPFHVRHGFPVTGDEPLGPGFDVVLYVTPMDEPGEFGGEPSGTTVRYTSDYVMRGESDACGPNYKSQDGPATCEWFVHDFPDGLPEGRFAMWAYWEAPCAAWVELGLASECSDPAEVQSLFQSGFDTPFHGGPSSFSEANEARLTPEQLDELYSQIWEDWEPTEEFDLGPPIDASGAVANFSTTFPDIQGAILGDDGSPPLPLGVVSGLPGEDRLDFLFEFCPDGQCYRDAHFMDPDNPDVGSGPWTAGRPFHVRHGFEAPGPEPLGPGFDVVMYITPMDEMPGEFGGDTAGASVRYGSDYVLRGESDACGPTYKSQDGTVTCEWFVHDFPDGLPAGRYDLWAVWEAPCWAWLDYGFTDSCADPAAVTSMFSSGVNSPFDDVAPSFTERNEA